MENKLIILTDARPHTYTFDFAAIPEAQQWDFQKWFAITPGRQLSDAGLQKWISDYRFFLESWEADKSELLLRKGIELAEIHLQHCREHEPKDYRQSDCLHRRIIAAKRMRAEKPRKAGKRTKEGEDAQPSHKPSQRERDALYLYYTEETIPTRHPLYKNFNKWSQNDYRLHSNSSPKSYNSKKAHLESVLIRVKKEKKRGWTNTANAISTDILKLTENFK